MAELPLPTDQVLEGTLLFLDEEDRNGRFRQLLVCKTDRPDGLKYQASYKIDRTNHLIDYGSAPREAICKVVLQAAQHFGVVDNSSKIDDLEDLF